MTKKSIRFYNDREVRAVWDETNSKWWFSATDIVRAINNEDDYTKSRNYWKYLKGKLGGESGKVVSITNQFKFDIATTPLMGRAKKKPIRFSRADCSIR